MGNRWVKRGFEEWIIVDRLVDIVLTQVKGCIVEIGIGGSTAVLAKHARNFGVKHYAVDVRKDKCDYISTNPNVIHPGFVICNESSFDFMSSFDDAPALVFIDGCHNSEVVREEAMFFLDRLLPGGIIFFHDMYFSEEWAARFDRKGKFSDAYLVRLELEDRRDIWCFTFPYTARGCGLTMVMKRPEYEYTCRDLDFVRFGDSRKGLSGRYRA